MSTLLKIITLILTAVTSSVPILVDGSVSGDMSVRARVTGGVVAVDATPAERERLAEAVALFDTAGLDLPAVEVHFNDTTDACKGNGGLYLSAPGEGPGTPDRIEICQRVSLTLVHELAHGWAHVGLGEQRRAELIAHWGLGSWNDPRDAWGLRGTERAAQAVAAGLALTTPTTNPNILRHVCDFELVTGRPLPDPDLFDCSLV